MTERIVFEQVRIFDGTRMLPENTVVVEEGTIAAVGGDLPHVADALVIDGTGLTLLPGLIDAHTHTFGPSGLRQALIFGVTTELDMFTDWRLAKQIKELQAREEGGQLADLRSAGTDAPMPGTMHGVSLHRELELLVHAGLTPLEALAAATSIPANAFGLGDRGRIAAGLRADLLLVEGDPGSDILTTRRIQGVWKRGKPVDRSAYRAELVHAGERAG